MKEFRKTKDGLFICEECGKIFDRKCDLGRHVNKYHNNQKEYFDKWLKENNDDVCKICGNLTKFNGLSGKGYKNCCCKKCSNKYDGIRTHEEIFKKYGNCGYGLEKNKATIKQNNLKKYGVENPAQNKEIYEKGQKTRLEIKKYKNTNIWYQGSYELDFLEKFYDKFPDIQRGPDIKYIFEGKNKVYHPDFYIPLLNTIIEIKSTWTYNSIIDTIKEKATIANGFKYLMILDKDYSSL
jgi:uncharacterized C2H2 Zn-finger protein